MAINGYPVCLDKQRRIDELEEQVKGLQAKLRYQERKELDGPFGSSTPSSKLPVKPNAEQKEKKPKGARPGHKGAGRKSHDEQAVDRTVEVGPTSQMCPECGGPLEKKGWVDRSVVDTPSKRPQKITFRLAKRYCPYCRRNVTAQPPGVLPKSLYGNQLIADAVEMHYLHGVPMGRVSEFLGIGAGSLVSCLNAAPASLREFRTSSSRSIARLQSSMRTRRVGGPTAKTGTSGYSPLQS